MEAVGNKLMEKLLEYAQNIEAFTKSEVPLYIKELLDFKFMEHLTNYFAPLLFSVGALVILIIVEYLFRSKMKDFDIYDYIVVPYVLATSFALLFSAISLLQYENLLQAYKIKIAPRVYVIEYLKGEIKGETKW